MLSKLRDWLSRQPGIFALLRKIIEINFKKQKKMLRSVIGQGNYQTVLDIGCGTGEFASAFKNSNYFGIDIYSEYIKYAKKHEQGEFTVMDATKLQFETDQFDFILIIAMLHHLDQTDANQVLKEAKRVLKPGGRILIMEDSKMPELETAFVRLVQKYDVGDFIRPPEEFHQMYSQYFTIEKEDKFLSGGCTYYAVSAVNN